MSDKVKEAITYTVEKQKEFGIKKVDNQYILHPKKILHMLNSHKNYHAIDNLSCRCILYHTIDYSEHIVVDILSKFGNGVLSIICELKMDEEEYEAMNTKKRYLEKRLVRLSTSALLIKLLDFKATLESNPTQNQINSIFKQVLYLEGNRNLSTTHEFIVTSIKMSILNSNNKRNEYI